MKYKHDRPDDIKYLIVSQLETIISVICVNDNSIKSDCTFTVSLSNRSCRSVSNNLSEQYILSWVCKYSKKHTPTKFIVLHFTCHCCNPPPFCPFHLLRTFITPTLIFSNAQGKLYTRAFYIQPQCFFFLINLFLSSCFLP